MAAINVEKQLEILSNPLKIKKVIFENNGIYDDCHNWISLASGKIAGVIKLKNGACAVLFKSECQSINIVTFDDDNINLQVSDFSIGQNYFGALNQENVDKYNDSVVYNNDRIERFTVIRKNSIDIKDLDSNTIEELGKIYSLSITEEEDIELNGIIIDDLYHDPSEIISRSMIGSDIEKVLSTLTPREARVLRLRFGLDDNIFRTLQEVGNEFNVTMDRIRQIEAKALRKLRHPSRSKKIVAYLLND